MPDPLQNSAKSGGYYGRCCSAAVGGFASRARASSRALQSDSTPCAFRTIATASDFSAQWSFTPPGHYAHPAVVQRLLKKRPNGDMYIEMSVFCESAKAACDRLNEEFTELNRQMREQMLRNNIEPPVQ